MNTQTQTPSFQSTTVEQLRAVVAEQLQIDAQQLQRALGSLIVSTSHEMECEADVLSIFDADALCLVLLADRIPAGQEAECLAGELARRCGSGVAITLLGEVAALQGVGGDLDAVAEWVGLHHGRNFDREPDVQRREWIERYMLAQLEGEELSVAAGAEDPLIVVELIDESGVGQEVEFRASSVLAHHNEKRTWAEVGADPKHQHLQDSMLEDYALWTEKRAFGDMSAYTVNVISMGGEPGQRPRLVTGEWSHLFGPGLRETRCRIVLDVEQSRVLAAQEWTGLKFEDVRGERLASLSESVIGANEAHDSPEDWGLTSIDELPAWAAPAMAADAEGEPEPLMVTRAELEVLNAAVSTYQELISSPTSADRAGRGDEWADREMRLCDALLKQLAHGAVRSDELASGDVAQVREDDSPSPV